MSQREDMETEVGTGMDDRKEKFNRNRPGRKWRGPIDKKKTDIWTNRNRIVETSPLTSWSRLVRHFGGWNWPVKRNDGHLISLIPFFLNLLLLSKLEKE